jgi:hypothetical protein
MKDGDDIGWGFGSCIWAPAKDRKGVPGRYKLILELDIGEQVIHVHNSVILATSFVATTAKETGPPPNPGPWGYARSFYRLELERFRKFKVHPTIEEFIAAFDVEIFRDIENNRPSRYPFAIYHYHAKPPEIKPVQGRFLTLATKFLKEAIDEATGECDP